MAGTAQKTDPALWERVKQHVTEGDKGGEPGQWSARKAQLAVAEYKKAGGGYVGRKRADNHLSEWTREEWGTRSGKPSGETGERYLPRRARQALSKGEYDRTTARKRADTAKGRQFSAQPPDVAHKTRKARMKDGNSDDIGREFRRLVNMTARQMRDWLATDHSREVGWTHEGEGEAVGHQSGRHILGLLQGKVAPDEAFQRKVVGYIHRHLAQRPDGDVSETRWRFSLMNWGHDPMRDDHEMQDTQAEAPAEQHAEEAAPRKRRASATKATGTRKAAAPRKRASSNEEEGGSTRRTTTRKTAARASATKATGTRSSITKRGTTTRSAGGKASGTRSTASRGKAASGSTRKAAGTGARKTSGATGSAAKRSAAPRSTASRSTGTAARSKTARSAGTSKAAGATPKASTRSASGKTAKPAATRKASTAKPGNGAAKRGSGTRGAAGRTAAAARGGRNGARTSSRNPRD